MSRKTRDAAKQRQQGYAHAIGGARAIVALLVRERDPLIELVLQIARNQIAPRATRPEPARIARCRLVVAIVKICRPARIAAL